MGCSKLKFAMLIYIQVFAWLSWLLSPMKFSGVLMRWRNSSQLSKRKVNRLRENRTEVQVDEGLPSTRSLLDARFCCKYANHADEADGHSSWPASSSKSHKVPDFRMIDWRISYASTRTRLSSSSGERFPREHRLLCNSRARSMFMHSTMSCLQRHILLDPIPINPLALPSLIRGQQMPFLYNA